MTISRMKERLHESGFCEHGFRENRKCHQCEPEPDVLKKYVEDEDYRIVATHVEDLSDAHEISELVADAIAEIKRLRKHDCENWSMEGIACARCNPIARELRAKFGNLDNRDAEPPEQKPAHKKCVTP